MTRADYGAYDLLVGMDGSNLAAMRRICGGDPDGKLRLLMEYTRTPRDVADPWYPARQRAYTDLQRGIPLQARLKIQREHTQSSVRAPAGFSFGSYFIYLSAVKPYGSIAPRDSAT